MHTLQIYPIERNTYLNRNINISKKNLESRQVPIDERKILRTLVIDLQESTMNVITLLCTFITTIITVKRSTRSLC